MFAYFKLHKIMLHKIFSLYFLITDEMFSFSSKTLTN